MPRRKTVVSVLGFDPCRIGAGEMFARELSQRLAVRGWHSVLCFLKEPLGAVRSFLAGPNVTIEAIEDSWRSSWPAMRGFAGILKRHQPSIVHLYFTGFLSAYPWIAKFLSVERVYFTDQNSQPEDFVPERAPLHKRLAMRAINGPITRVISVSRYAYDAFTTLDLIPKERFRIVYNAVDLERAQAGAVNAADFRRKHRISSDAIVIAQASWLIPEKGLEDLLFASRQVAAAEPRAHFLVAGDGVQRQKLEMLARDLGISQRLTFTGPVNDPLGEGLYAASDIVCQLSRWEEAFGYTNIEAMACGKPVVGTRVGGIPEIIQDGVTGFLVPKRDTAAIAERILQLLRDPEMRRRMGDAGREICRARFNLKDNVEQLIQLYESEV